MEKEFKKTISRMDERINKFEKILNQHEKAFMITLKEIQAFREEAREHRQTMASLMHTDIKQERSVEDLIIRVERLELKIN